MEKILDVSRYTNVTELQFEVEFITPCFLGGADGNAEIRTAPFKNLLRRWWRIANGNLPLEELWKQESRLFGSTENDPDVVASNRNKRPSEREPEVFGKSKVELRILKYDKNCYSSERIDIGKVDSSFGKMDLGKYLGYGSVGNKKYIKPNTKISFSLIVPSENKSKIIDTLFLMHLFGSVGSKSRNGFGSIYITPANFEFSPKNIFDGYSSWKEILNENKNYPSSICKDEKGCLAWKTDDNLNWKISLEEIGTVYYKLRKQLDVNSKKILGFAESDKRLPKQLIIKICKTPKRKYYGLIVHIPYLVDKIPKQIQLNAGEKIHSFLDKSELQGWQRKFTKEQTK